MSYESPRINIGQSILFYPGNDKSNAAPGVVSSMNDFQRGSVGVHVFFKQNITPAYYSCVLHCDNPWLIENPNFLIRNGTWDFVTPAEQPEKKPEVITNRVDGKPLAKPRRSESFSWLKEGDEEKVWAMKLEGKRNGEIAEAMGWGAKNWQRVITITRKPKQATQVAEDAEAVV